jgi:hypothetical protein
MRIRIFTGNRRFAVAIDARAAKLLERDDISGIRDYQPERGDLSYLDVTGLEAAEQKRRVALLKGRCGNAAWGILDPKGCCPDPAALFHLGAADYLGPQACKKGLTKARIKAALAFNGDDPEASGLDPKARIDEYPFAGWSSLKRGSPLPFYFLYFGVEGAAGLKRELGEQGYAAFRERLRDYLQQSLAESNALLWIESESSGLFLIPPSRKKAQAAVEACLRGLLNAPIIGYEKLGMGIPISLVFALHFGSSAFEAPGKTGTIVSEDVNFIFHLGAKAARANRITLSQAAERAIPDKLGDLFGPAGSFEGRGIRASSRFLWPAPAVPRG